MSVARNDELFLPSQTIVASFVFPRINFSGQSSSNTSTSLRSTCATSHIHFLILEFRFQHPVEIDACRISDDREHEAEQINDLPFRVLQKCQLESEASTTKQTRSCLLVLLCY